MGVKLEKIIQIAVNPNSLPVEFLALTDEGRLFRRYGLIDSATSQWELIDLPLFTQKEKPRAHKPESSEIIEK